MTTSALNAFRFQAAWKLEVMASVGAPPPTKITAVGTLNWTFAVPLTVGSNVLVAVTVIVCAALIVAGAVYLPSASMEPTCGLRLQVTPVWLTPSTVAVKRWVPPAASVTLAGDT
jgi:hypothetical protein